MKSWRAVVTAGAFVVLAAAIALVIAQPPANVRGGTSGYLYMVNTTADPIQADINCSLREAIVASNNDDNDYNGCLGGTAGTDGNIIRFDPAVFPVVTPATILISSSVGQMTGLGDTIDATAAGVIIDGSATEDRSLHCLVVVSDNNTVQGLQITDCSRGISLLSVAESNNISSNVLYDNLVGVFLEGNSNQLNGNRVGTNATGTAVHPDGGNYQGIAVTGDGNQIGGVSPNVVSGNDYSGIEIQLADLTVVAGNYVGTDITGTVAIANPTGINVQATSTNTTIGGASAPSRNVISGNQVGVSLGGGSSGTAVLGNHIGTDAAGGADLGNLAGVSIQNSAENCIGGTFQATSCTTGMGTRNVISGNNAVGVQISQAGSINNSVLGNYIGLAADGVTPLGNGTYGVYIDASSNEVGYLNPGDGNRIAYNTQDGVKVSGGTDNSILSNEIFSNQGLGIDLGLFAGVTANDLGDTDTGANDLQNFPVLDSATNTSVQGTLNSTPNTEFFIQFFDSASCDPSGFGEGEHVAGAGGGVTDMNGDLSFNVALSPVANGRYITAVAAPDAPPHNSSEFSACLQVGAATPTPSPSPSPTPTQSPTPTATPTGSASPSPTASLTATPTGNGSPTPTPTGSPATGTPTTTPTPTPTPTVTPTSTGTATPTPTGAGQQVIWGDNNCANGVEPVDALLTLRHDAALSTNTGDCPDMGEAVLVDGVSRIWGDLDCSDLVDAIDALKVLRHDAGLSVARPPTCPDPGETVTVTEA